MWSSCGSTHCTCQLTILSNSDPECGVVFREFSWRWPLNSCSAGYGCFVNGWQVSCTVLLKCLLCFPTWNIVTRILCMDFAMAIHVLMFKNTKGVFAIEGFRLEVYLREFTRRCVILFLFQVFLCSLKGRWYDWLTHERTFFRWFREVHVCPLVEWPLSSAYHLCRCGELYMGKICILTMIKGYNIWNQATMLSVWICASG